MNLKFMSRMKATARYVPDPNAAFVAAAGYLPTPGDTLKPLGLIMKSDFQVRA